MSAAPLKIGLRPEKHFVSEGRPNELLLLVRILPEDVGPPPFRRLALVVDRTALASEEAARELARSVRLACETLGPDDEVSITLSGEAVDVLLPSTRVRDVGNVEALVASVTPTSTSVGYAAWLGAAMQLADDWDRDAINRILLVSASPDMGHSPGAESFVSEARGLFRRGVSTSTVGCGLTFDEDLLVSLAVEGGGNAWFAEDLHDLSTVIEAESRALGSVYSEWATLRFDMAGADVVDVLNDLPWVAERKIALPPLVGNAPFHLVVLIRLHPGELGSELSPVTLRIKNLDTACRNATVHRKALKLQVVSSALADSMQADVSVRAHAARLQLLRSQSRCITHLDAGDASAARDLLDSGLSRFRSLSGMADSALLARELETLERAREWVLDPASATLVRKLLRYTGIGALRSDLISRQRSVDTHLRA